MAPKIVVLAGGHAFERVRGLLNGMVQFPDLDSFGQVMVEMMASTAGLSPEEQEPLLQRYLQRFILKDNEDPEFDKRIMLEALTFGARMFRMAWDQQVPHCLNHAGYQFNRWLGSDLVLERRDSL